MLADCAAPVLVTRAHLRDRLAVGTATVIDLDADQAAIGREPRTTPDDGAGPQDLAYVIYTSGSTGKPKGVLAAHEASVNRFAWMWRRWPFTPHDVCCQKTSLSFVDSVWEIFGPLLQGVPTVIVPDEAVGDPVRLVELLATHRVTRIVLVPSVLKHLLDTVPDIARHLPDLQFWVTSGEAIPVDVARRFAELLPGATLVNLYGSSEVTADVLRLRRHRRRPSRAHPDRPADRQHAPLRARHAREPGPDRRAGRDPRRRRRPRARVPARRRAHGKEVRSAIRSPAMRGRGSIGPATSGGSSPTATWNTSGAWTTRSSSAACGSSWARSRACCARIRRFATRWPSSPRPGARRASSRTSWPATRRPESSELRRYVRERLPDHTVPSAFIFLDALPMTPSGKLDRRALLSLAPTPAEGARALRRPADATEDALAAIMAEVLKVDRVGIHDDFFELGGHSLLAVQVIARVRKILHVELPMRSLFTEPTVAGLGPEVERARASGVVPAMPPPTRGFGSRDQLQARLAGLSDAEVEALLARLDSRKPGERETEEL